MMLVMRDTTALLAGHIVRVTFTNPHEIFHGALVLEVDRKRDRALVQLTPTNRLWVDAKEMSIPR